MKGRVGSICEVEIVAPEPNWSRQQAAAEDRAAACVTGILRRCQAPGRRMPLAPPLAPGRDMSRAARSPADGMAAWSGFAAARTVIPASASPGYGARAH